MSVELQIGANNDITLQYKGAAIVLFFSETATPSPGEYIYEQFCSKVMGAFFIPTDKNKLAQVLLGRLGNKSPPVIIAFKQGVPIGHYDGEISEEGLYLMMQQIQAYRAPTPPTPSPQQSAPQAVGESTPTVPQNGGSHSISPFTSPNQLDTQYKTFRY